MADQDATVAHTAPRKTLAVPPGIAVTIVIIPACLLPFFWEHLMALEKALWIAFIVTLVVIEITAIYNERDKHEMAMDASRVQSQFRFERTMERFEQMGRASDLHNHSVLRLMQMINDPAQSLKKKALALSESILDFVYLRIQGQPQEGPPISLAAFARPQGLGAFSTPTFGVYMKYDRDTILHYKERFSSKVAAILEELAKHGLADDVLDKRSKDLRYGSDIMTIGERLGKLAERIEDANKA